MRTGQIIYLSLSLLFCCNNTAHRDQPAEQERNVVVANEFVDVFYSFNRDSLDAILSNAAGSRAGILFYQKWAECGHYKIVRRGTLIEKNDSLVIVPVTVKDDLMGALQIDLNVTDTFRLAIRDGQIRSVHTSSNDPDTYYEAKEWVKKNRPDLVEKACEGIWAEGSTPCECVKGMVKGLREFRASRKY